MHIVYWLKSKKRNYIGYTIDLGRRLRQHNGELKGGALRTKHGTWSVHRAVSGFETKQAALRYEFALKLKRTDSAKYDFMHSQTVRSYAPHAIVDFQEHTQSRSF